MCAHEIDVSYMAASHHRSVDALDFVDVVAHVQLTQRRFNNAVTSDAMTIDVTRAVRIPTNAAIEPRPRTSKTLRVATLPTRIES